MSEAIRTGQERLSALYTCGLPADVVRWDDVTVAVSDGSGKLGPAQRREFMDGFSYPYSKVGEDARPEFFGGFSPTAIKERNLIWDTHMFEDFGQGHIESPEIEHSLLCARRRGSTSRGDGYLSQQGSATDPGRHLPA